MGRQRSINVVLLALGALAALAGVTRIPSAPVPPQHGGGDPVPPVVVHSSTRGTVEVAVAPAAVGGQPYNPGGQAEAAARLTERHPVGEGGSPAGPVERSRESIIGADGRTWLRGDTTRFPNTALGRIDFRQAGGSYWCTGTLIDADTVLTAGHCVHDGLGDETGWSTRVEFTPGAEGNRAPFGSCGARELVTLPGWYSIGSEHQDLGLVHLDCTIGDTVGWFGYRAAPGPKGLTNVPAHVRGYPGDKVWSTLWTMRDRVRISQAQMVFYAADTYGGQSGSPVFYFRPCNGVRGPCVLAVHAYGVHPGRNHGEYNHGPRLDEARLALVATLAADG